MPRSKQAGFIFAEAHQNVDLALTIAHELGHGAFHLRHTFFENNLEQGATDNLMDYPAKSRLDKWQWDKIHNPERVLGLFEGDEEGALNIGPLSITSINITDGGIQVENEETITCISPSGAVITLPPATDSYDFTPTIPNVPFGSLAAFSYRDEQNVRHTFVAAYQGEKFKGYFELGDITASTVEGKLKKVNDSWIIYRDNLTAAKSSKANVLLGFPNGCKIELWLLPFSKLNIDPSRYVENLGGIDQDKLGTSGLYGYRPQSLHWKDETDADACGYSLPLSLTYQQLLNEGNVIIDKSGRGTYYKIGNTYIHLSFKADGSYHWQQWDGVSWQPASLQVPQKMQPVLVVLAIWGELLQDPHLMLDAAGSTPIPVLDQLADGVNGLLYFVEGDNTNAYISLAGATLPVAGNGLKYTLRAARSVIKGRTIIRYPDEFVKAMDQVYDGLRNNTASSSEQFLAIFKNINTLAVKYGEDGQKALMALSRHTEDKVQFGKVLEKIRELEQNGAENLPRLLADINESASFAEIVAKKEELVEGWRVIKNSAYDDLAKLATNLDELDLVSKNLDDVTKFGGYKEWNRILRGVVKNGDELVYRLSKIDAPKPEIYKGDFYRTVGNGRDPLLTHYIPRGTPQRYAKPREDAIFFSSSKEGNLQELAHWDVKIEGNTTTFVYKEIQSTNLLDLTNSSVRDKIGISLDQITSNSYEFTDVIGTWARDKKYSGIIYPSARGTVDNKYFVNVAVFDSGTANQIIKGKTIEKILN